MTYKNNYSVSHSSVSSRKKYKKKKKFRYGRVIFAALLVVLIVFLGKSTVSLFLSHNNKLIQEEIPASKLLSEQELFVLSSKNRPTILLANALNWKYSIVPNSNHIGSAEEYAYSTKEIRSYITGKKQYTGKDKLVFLTFDDGANQKISPIVLDTLKNEGVHGTFFIVGGTVGEKNRNVLEREINEGHGIAIHSFTHNYKILYPGRRASGAKVTEEYKRTLDEMQAIWGKQFNTKVFRYPGGHMSWKNMDESDNALAAYGVEWIDWNALCGDGEPKKVRPTTAQGMYDFTIRTTKQNKNQDVIVVLMHDAENKRLTAEALPKIIKYFKDNGYKFGILK